MITDNLALLFERDILKLKTEISSYTDDATIWLATGQTANSAGNLCLHLLGNLQYYIGAVLGGTGYIRNRSEEFSKKDVPVKEMINSLEQVAVIVTKTIRHLPEETLDREYPVKVFDYTMNTGYFLMHLLAHLNYHLGQINYHRRLLNTSPAPTT